MVPTLIVHTVRAMIVSSVLSIAYGFSPNSVKRFTIAARRPLYLARVSVSNPSQEQAVDLGIREWPQQLKRGKWDERISESQAATRYVLEGTGELDITDNDGTQSIQFGPGILLEIEGDAELKWACSDDVILLTPGFEEGGKLLIVAVGLVVLTVVLVAVSSGN